MARQMNLNFLRSASEGDYGHILRICGQDQKSYFEDCDCPTFKKVGWNLVETVYCDFSDPSNEPPTYRLEETVLKVF